MHNACQSSYLAEADYAPLQCRMRILLVKTSSMGDVIHNLPVASDIRTRYPDASIDWAVEEAFAEIPALHPAIDRVIPVAIRRWRRALLARKTLAEMRVVRDRLVEQAYDVVLDTQGLLKSALLATWAGGERKGYTFACAREPLAALFYTTRYHVDKSLHAVERNRRLAALALGYELPATLDYGIHAAPPAFAWLPQRYAVLLHGTSRDDKRWPDDRWISLGKQLHGAGLICVLPWGTSSEQERSQRLAAAIEEAIAPPRLQLTEAASLLASAGIVIGVDTGLTHLAAALHAPVVAIYCASDPGLTGVHAGPRAVNLGGRGTPPTVEQVLALAKRLRQSA
jgi:heptosyltransferase-1